MYVVYALNISIERFYMSIIFKKIFIAPPPFICTLIRQSTSVCRLFERLRFIVFQKQKNNARPTSVDAGRTPMTINTIS